VSTFKFDEILRYALAGGIAILAAWLGYKEPALWLAEKREGALLSIGFVALPVLIGALAYVLHRALAHPFIYGWMAKRVGRGDNTIALDIARWKHQERRGALQGRMSEWAAQVHFLYAALWAVLGVNAVAHIGAWTQSRWHYLQLGLVPLLLLAAVLHHWRYQRWEGEVFNHDAALQSEV
jgi:hypothetical protein